MSKVLSPLPKYGRIVEQIRHDIKSGALRPGDRLPSLSEMRLGRGVSRGTMDKAHSILIAEGLIARRHGVGTFVLDSQAPQSKGIIGLCGFGFRFSSSSYYWSSLLQGVQQQAESGGSQVLLLPYEVQEGWGKVDGVLLSDSLNSYYRNLIPSPLPIVCLFGMPRGRAGVAADEYSGMAESVKHLLSLGHRRIAYLHSPAKTNWHRVRSYQDTLRAAGINPPEDWQRALKGKQDFGPDFMTAGHKGMSAWLCDNGPNGWKQINCTALLCHNDDTAIGALHALSEAGLKVPEDVSVVGFDGSEIGQYCSPTLTSVTMPIQQMGQVAVELLQKQISEDKVLNEHRILPTQLRVRQSTCAPSQD